MYEIRNICNGVRLVCVNSDKYKTATIAVKMAVPLDENAAVNAVMVKLLKRSCKAYPDFSKISARFDELYGAMFSAYSSKIGDAQVLSLNCVCVDDRFSLDGESVITNSCDLLLEMLFNPNVKNKSFGNKNLSLEKRFLIESLIEEKNNKISYASDRCIQLMFKDEPYGLNPNGTIENVKKIKIPDVYTAWQNVMKKAVFQITVIGNVDIDKLSVMFAEKFSSIERSPYKIKTKYRVRGTKFIREEENIPVNQGKLVIGYRAGTKSRSDNRFAVTVMNDIFGGGVYSRLFTVIREKMSLAYYCSSGYRSDKGIILVQSGIDTDKEKKVTEGVAEQLDLIRNGDFDDELIASSKKALKEKMTFPVPTAICNWYSSQILEDSIISPEEMIEGIEKVTKDEICAAAKKVSLDKVFMLSANTDSEAGNED